MSRKRKAGEEPYLPTQPPLSAFAAAKVRQNGLPSTTRHANPLVTAQEANLETGENSKAWSQPDLDYDSEAGMSQGPDGDDESESQTEAHDPTPMEVQLSTWGPSNDVHPNKSKENVQLLPQGQQRVKLTYGQTLAVLGQYDLKVLSGVITVYGVLLTPKSDTRRIVAPSTHPLPVIRCVSGDGAEVQFLSILREDESLKSMERVSPLFKGIWHCECGKYALDELGHSFTKIQRSTDHDLKRPVIALDIPYSWQQVLGILSDRAQKGPRIIQVCGPFSSGKSTFCRLLVNTLLKQSKESKTEQKRVAFLDLDLERPEMSLPGHVSLSLLSAQIFQPAFAHQMVESARAHAIEIDGYKGNAQHYLDSARDLLQHYHDEVRSPHRGLPDGKLEGLSLIVHCPPWYQGSGNSLIVNLTSVFGATDVIFLSEPPSRIQDILKTTSTRSQVHVIPPRAEQNLHLARTPAQLREMRLLSYFHSVPNSKLKYNPTPISSWRPYSVSYSRQKQDFAGVFIFGESPAMYSNAISTLLNGSLVSMLVVEDDAVLEERKIVRGEGDGIPFFAAELQGYSKPFDPECSRTVGVALIRSIDVERKTLWLLTPGNVGDLPRKKTVLAFGGLESPGWAYLENHHFREYAGTADSKDVRHVLTDALSESPWVEYSIEPGDERVDTRLGMQAWKTRRFKGSK